METDSDAVSRASLVISFCHMTSASHDDALFFLESHNFDLDTTLFSFFNNRASRPNLHSPTQHVDPKNSSCEAVTGGTSTLSNLKRPPTDTAAHNSGSDSRN